MRRSPRLRAVLTAVVLAAAILLVPGTASARGGAPGDFTGYGFDQCVAPGQHAMNRWLHHSPFWAVGIYISGDSRGCRHQPNLTPAWVRTQVRKGWRLLPITFGPQASCNPRFPRYRDDHRINNRKRNHYGKARAQARAEANRAVSVAKGLGIGRGSVLWYDIEAFDIHHSRACNASAMWFLSAWTHRLHKLGYDSGVYSSAASGIVLLDRARRDPDNRYHLPDNLWIADWNGRANVHTDYISDEGWSPHRRVHQYQGGHDERHGGVTINIDRNWVDLGRGSVAGRGPRHCVRDGGGIGLDFTDYTKLAPGTRKGDLVRALKCRLAETGWYHHPHWMGPGFGKALLRSAQRYQKAHHLRVRDKWIRRDWMVLLSDGPRPLVKVGATGGAVRRLQRALNAADVAHHRITGVFTPATMRAVKRYQRSVGMGQDDGVARAKVWRKLASGTK